MTRLGSLCCPHCQRWHPSAEFCGCEGAKAARVKPIEDAIQLARMKSKSPTPEMKAFRDDLLAVLNKHAGALDASEMLALAAYMVGQMVAMQDARKWTPELAMDLVAKNIELGNAQAISEADKWMPRA